MEIELKFLLNPSQVSVFKETIEQLDFDIEDHGQSELSNAYYDTKSQSLRKLDIGLRTRSIEKLGTEIKAEQTVKLAGADVAGLQQRPEYTVPIVINEDTGAAFANLSLFDPNIWPESFDVKAVDAELVKVFETRFHRDKWLITTACGDQVECVLDTGKVEAECNGEMQQQDICEFELELIDGKVNSLVDIALQITKRMPAKLGYLSKAARGYQTAQGIELKAKNLEAINLNKQDSVEQAMERSLSYALNFIQHNELVFAKDKKPKSFRRVMDGVSLLIQVLTLFSPYLSGSRCDRFVADFKSWRGKVSWLESFYQLEKLQDRKSPYRKDIESREALMALIAAEKMPKDKIESLANEFSSHSFNQLMLSFIEWLALKGWRNEMALKDLANLSLPIEYETHHWLTKAWNKVKENIQSLNLESGHKGVERAYWQLVAGLLTGIVVGNLYPENDREQFRSQLLNMLLGLEEFILLMKLKQVISQEPELEQESVKWIAGKMDSLYIALSASSGSVGKLKPYW